MTRSQPIRSAGREVAAPGPEGREANSGGRGLGATTALSVAALVTLALRFWAGVIPSNWLWGLDSFAYRPLWESAGLFVLAAAGLVPPLAGRIDQALGALGERWERADPAADAALAIGCGVALYWLRDPLHFTGDFAQRVGMLRISEDLVHNTLARSFPLDILLNYELPRRLIVLGLGQLDAQALVGAVVGAAFVWVACRFARAAGACGAALPGTVLVLIGGGAVVHFAGYDKFGPLLLGFACTAVGVVHVARGRGGLGWLATGTVLTLLAHRSGYLVLPAVGWTLAQSFRRDPTGRRRALAAAAIVLVVAAALAPRAAHLLVRFDLAAHLPGGKVAESRVAPGAPRLLTRASDTGNAVLFVVPLALLGLAAGLALFVRRSRVRPMLESPGASFSLGPPVALALAGALALLVAVEPGAGWARDWDVATGPGVIVSLVAAGLLAQLWRDSDRTTRVAPAVTLGLASAIALWGLQTRAPVALARIHTLLEARPRLSEATRAQWYDFLGVRALNTKRPAEAAAQFERAVANSPSPRLFTMLGLAELAQGRRESARARFEHAVALDSGALDAWMELARMAMADEDTAATIRCLDSVLVHKPGQQEVRAARDALEESFTGRARGSSEPPRPQ